MNASKQFYRELRTGLKDLITERDTQMKEHKSKILFQLAFFKEYGSSEHVNQIHEFLDSLNNKPESREIKLQTVIHIRDYLIFTLCYDNALIASNVINITLQELESAQRNKEIKDDFVFRNKKI